MKMPILDTIDFDKVNLLLEGFNKSTGFVTAILDLKGNVLSKSGWRTLCTEFHRKHPDTAKQCTESDTKLADQMGAGQKYHCYKCLNGLIDVVVPIVIQNDHVANLFTGQFFFEKPDRDFFIKQAERYGFDKRKYLDALDRVPVVSEERVKDVMEFLLTMTLQISDMTLQRMELVEHQRHETLRVETELAKAKEELSRKARLAAIGQVSASMAHDLRNPLGSARNACYLLRRRLDSERSELTDPITIIEKEIDRANGIITNLLAIAHAREPRREAVDLGVSVREVYDHLKDHPGIEFQMDLDPTPFMVWVDRNQFEQVFSNIMINAIQATEGTGRMTVRAQRGEHLDLIEFQDTGPGLDPKVRQTLFDPLITTKARGTGLGLTICKQIVEAHGGIIEALEAENGGTLIRIQLKRAKT